MKKTGNRFDKIKYKHNDGNGNVDDGGHAKIMIAWW